MLFRSEGSRLLTGSNPKEEIQAALEEMREGKLKVLVATNIFGEGIDVPAISTIVMADAAKSHIKVLQRIGRGMRTQEGKKLLHVHEFIDDTDGYLLEHSTVRHKLYEAEGFKCVLDRGGKDE